MADRRHAAHGRAGRTRRRDQRLSAIIVGPSGSSEASASVRYVLDNSKPKTKIVSPKDNAQVNRKAVEIKGTTQARATLIARNDTNDASVSGVAEADGHSR